VETKLERGPDVMDFRDFFHVVWRPSHCGLSFEKSVRSRLQCALGSWKQERGGGRPASSSELAGNALSSLELLLGPRLVPVMLHGGGRVPVGIELAPQERWKKEGAGLSQHESVDEGGGGSRADCAQASRGGATTMIVMLAAIAMLLVLLYATRRQRDRHAAAAVRLQAEVQFRSSAPPATEEGASAPAAAAAAAASSSSAVGGRGKRAAKSPARGGKSPARGGQYVDIDGERYDRSLIVLADALQSAKAAAGKASHLGKADAVKLWKDAKDGPGVTDTERKTLAFIRDTYAMTAEAEAFLVEQIEVTPSGSGYYASLAGRTRSEPAVTVDRRLWGAITLLAKDGKIDLSEARKVWEEVLDGPGVTSTEKGTLLKALREFEFTKGARDFLAKKMDEL